MQVIRITRRIMRVLGASLIASIASVSAIQAQDQPAVFVHGLKQSGASWGYFAYLLRNQFQLRPVTPTLGWRKVYAEQADALHVSLDTVGSGVAAIAHSNGGVVVRTYLNRYGSASRIDRVLTVGSLHQGSSLAGHLLNGTLGRWGGNIAGSMGSAIGFYANNDPAWPYILQEIGSDFADDLNTLAFAFQRIDLIVAGLGYVSPSLGVPVLSEMPPGSPTFQQLNSSAGLQLETSLTTYRASIATTASAGRMPWALISPNHPAWIEGVWLGAMSLASAMYTYYAVSDDWWLQQNKWRWKDMWVQLYYIPTIWQYQIGASTHVANGVYMPVAGGLNDGVVTWATADYPNGEARHITTQDISHIEQLGSFAVKNDVAFVLSARFGFAPRTSSPPPPPSYGGGSGGAFTASLLGPTEITPANTCGWVAGVSGGSGSYSYTWSRNGSVVSTESSYTGGMDGAPSFTLTLVASDGGSSVTRTIVVTNTGTGECLQVSQ